METPIIILSEPKDDFDDDMDECAPPPVVRTSSDVFRRLYEAEMASIPVRAGEDAEDAVARDILCAVGEIGGDGEQEREMGEVAIGEDWDEREVELVARVNVANDQLESYRVMASMIEGHGGEGREEELEETVRKTRAELEAYRKSITDKDKGREFA